MPTTMSAADCAKHLQAFLKATGADGVRHDQLLAIEQNTALPFDQRTAAATLRKDPGLFSILDAVGGSPSDGVLSKAELAIIVGQ